MNGLFEGFVWKTRARTYGWLQAKIDNPSTSGMQKAKATNELVHLALRQRAAAVTPAANARTLLVDAIEALGKEAPAW